MRLPRPRLHLPRPRLEVPDDDARLLLRTRLRLMAWSGGITIVILFILGIVVYQLVTTAIETGGRQQLERIAIVGEAESPYSGIVSEGEAAGVYWVGVSPAGDVANPLGITVPKGLPNQDSLKEVTPSHPIDMRNVRSSDGTPYRVLSGYPNQARFPNWKVQWIQNRSGEVAFINSLRLTLLGGSAFALLLAIFFGYLYAGRALVPIRDSIIRRQAALQRQREFAANASHELRTPLTVMRASLEDLRRNRRRRVDEVGEALGDMESEVQTLTALVEDMLLLARTDSGVVQIERVPLDLSDEAAEAVSPLTAMAAERGVSVMLDPLPAPVSGDPMRLRQLVTILVDNAIRHSPSGTTVEVRVRPEENQALLEVLDQGPGIKPEDLPRLWERFWRADGAPAGGTGLGLAIARWIVEQHGGTIGAENREEGGARFWVRLPVVWPGAIASEDLAEGSAAGAEG